MSTAFTPPRTRITTERYQRMIASGVLTRRDRIELIEGEMFDRAPIGPRHAALTTRLTRLFVRALGDSAVVSPGGPINLGEFSEPQPDILLLKPRADDYSSRVPEAGDVLLLIEVSDSTLAFDQGTKLSMYARYRVSEYWVIDVGSERVVSYRGPTPRGYDYVREFAATDALSPLAFPDVEIVVGQLFA
jgi:Uma2 family endonuclease